MNANHNTLLQHRNLAEDPEFLEACRIALQDPDKKEQIICILRRAELAQSSVDQPA